MAAALEIEGLVAGYRPGADVLRGVSLAIAEGEAVSILGANGAGKSTLLRTVSGLLRPRDGTIRFRGEDVSRTAPHRIARAGLAHVPEGRQIFVGQTVDENLRLGAMGMERLEQRRTELLEVFPVLREKLRQPAGELSGGQQQMLAIARGLMSSPSLLMLDEPSLGLSPKLVDEVGAMLARLRDVLGVTLLVVEQNAALAAGVTERAYVLRRGEVVLEQPTDELLGSEDVLSAYLT